MKHLKMSLAILATLAVLLGGYLASSAVINQGRAALPPYSGGHGGSFAALPPIAGSHGGSVAWMPPVSGGHGSSLI